MRKVGIVGAGITECRGRWIEATYWELFQQATRRACEDATVTVDEIDSVVYGIYNDIFEHQAIPESSLTGLIGMANKPGTRVTSGGATGFYAMRTAYMEVASGVSETVLCVGGEKATDCFDPRSQTATPMVIDTIAKSWDLFSTAGHGERFVHAERMGYDTYPGISVPTYARMIEILCPVTQSLRAKTRGVGTWIRPGLTLDIAPFLRLLEACMYTEGAGAIVFASEDKARRSRNAPAAAHLDPRIGGQRELFAGPWRNCCPTASHPTALQPAGLSGGRGSPPTSNHRGRRLCRPANDHHG
jgi:acetyl-CoA C-acetyltransferase